MKKFIITLVITIVMAIESIDSPEIKNRHITPVVYEIENLPVYFRKKPLRYVPFNA